MPLAESSDVAFCNAALAMLGEDSISDLLPESGSTQAMASTLYQRTVDEMLCRHPWNFSTQRIALSELAADPPSPWSSQYELPAGTLRVIRTDIPGEMFSLYSDTDGSRRLFANRSAIKADVVVNPGEGNFPPHFAAALIKELAATFAMPLTGRPEFATYFRDEARRELARAIAIDASEHSPRTVADGERDWREGGGTDRSIPGLYVVPG